MRSGGAAPGQNGDWINDSDGSGFAARGHAESVCSSLNFVFKEGTNAIYIAGFGEGTIQQSFKIAVKIVISGTEQFQACRFSDCFEFGARQCARVRWIAKNLPVIEGCLPVLARSDIADEDGAARSTDTLHLAESFSRVEEVVEGKPGNDAIESGVGKGEIGAWAELPGHVGDLLLGLKAPRTLKHGGDDVEAGDVANTPGEEAGDDAGAAGYVEDSVFGPDSGAFGHQVEERILLVSVALRKWIGLAGELIENFSVVDFGFVVRRFHRTIMRASLG